jgi:NADH dehydrogenase
MELWAQMIGEPLLKSGKTTVFGRGDNPINFVSSSDVARFVEMAVIDHSLQGKIVEVGGPQNLSMNQFEHVFQDVAGKAGKVSHVPLPMMRIMSVLMRPINPAMARQIASGVVMDTRKMSFDATESRCLYPSIPVTSLTDVVKRDYGADQSILASSS